MSTSIRCVLFAAALTIGTVAAQACISPQVAGQTGSNDVPCTHAGKGPYGPAPVIPPGHGTGGYGSKTGGGSINVPGGPVYCLSEFRCTQPQ